MISPLPLVAPDTAADTDEDAPKSRGSEAVERRIEKLISELKESGAADVMSEREFEAKKVKFHPPSVIACPPPLSQLPYACRLSNTPFLQANHTTDVCFARTFAWTGCHRMQ